MVTKVETDGTLTPEQQQELVTRLSEAARDGRVACPVALSIAESLSIPPAVVGRVVDQMHLKFNRCQLGCFK